MTTVDYQAALNAANGKYPEDNWYAIVAYLPPFLNADTAYKLVKNPMVLRYAIDSFNDRRIIHSIVWMRENNADVFKHNDGAFRKWIQENLVR